MPTLKKTAVVLLNLGGPDSPQAVRPFLFNLFNDPAILRVPQPFRFLLAWWIAKQRAPIAQMSYAYMGGKSPLLANTQVQAFALQKELGSEDEIKVFIAMRYWHPLIEETVRAVRAWGATRVILLPLYPQYSSTTTASSYQAWREEMQRQNWNVPTTLIECYPEEPGLIKAGATLIKHTYEKAATYGRPRLLLSAHGLPEKIIKAGDPYAEQCQKTAMALINELRIPNLDWVLCYQSRVGPLKWIGPSTDDEIKRAGQDCVPVVIYPLSFVSEHIETLVEIGEEYRHLALQSGVPFFEKAMTVGTHPEFIKGLARLVRDIG